MEGVMSTPVETGTQWASEFQARFGAAPGAQTAEAEREKLIALCNELLADRERLRAELAAARAERDDFRQGILVLTRKEFPFSKEELLAQVSRGPSLRELVNELKKDAGM